MNVREITYVRAWKLATFTGPGGFTQYTMPEVYAQAIAEAFDIPFLPRDEPRD